MQKRLLNLTVIIFTGLVSVAQFSAFAADETQSFTVELSNPGKPATLHIDSHFLKITVAAEDRKDMVFEISPRDYDSEYGHVITRTNDKNRAYNFVYNDRHDIDVGLETQRQRDTSGMTRIDSNPGFVVEELNNMVRFDSEFMRQGYQVKVKVPVNTSLKLENVNGGPLTVSGVNGTHELSNTNGPVYASDISGSVVAETTNGTIEVTMSSVTKDTPMAFSTTNGSVDVTFPASYRADAVIDPGRGSTYTDFEFVTNNTAHVERLEGEKGKRIEVKREIRGKINGGGPTLRMETFNGNIYIRKGK